MGICMKKILVTGANGFVGTALCASLLEQGYHLRAAMRSHFSALTQHPHFEIYPIGEIDQTNWQPLLKDVDLVIHLAARVHQMNDSVKNAEAEYDRVNVRGTEKIAEAALKAGVKRFVFLSSIKVNGEESLPSGFKEQDEVAPEGFYALSKWEAEQVLIEKTRNTALELVILRTPLVYGKGVKANFAKLIQLVKPALPLPLNGINNKRSFIYIDNLVSALSLVSFHPEAKGNLYLVADSEMLSTTELIQEIAMAKGFKAKLLPVPQTILRLMAKLLSKEASTKRLLGSLAVDNSKIKTELGWNPPYSLSEGLRRMFNSCS